VNLRRGVTGADGAERGEHLRDDARSRQRGELLTADQRRGQRGPVDPDDHRPANAPLDGGPGSVVGAINAVTAQTGVTAAFDPTTQKVTLTGTGAFYVTDAKSPGATTTGNLTAVLHLASTSASNQADMVQNVSTQLTDIGNVLNTVLNARSVIGSRIQTLSSIGSQLQTSVTDNTNVESGIEDVDVASATSKFTATQTASRPRTTPRTGWSPRPSSTT